MATRLSINIIALRNSLGLTQSELGARLHKAGSTVRMWELDKASPDAETLLALSRIFGVSIDYLLLNGESLGIIESAALKSAPKSKHITKINNDLTRLNHKQLKLVSELVSEMSRSDS